jgi:hypothetical protein
LDRLHQCDVALEFLDQKIISVQNFHQREREADESFSKAHEVALNEYRISASSNMNTDSMDVDRDAPTGKRSAMFQREKSGLNKLKR